MMVHPNFVHFATGWPGCETHGPVCFDSYILAGSEYKQLLVPVAISSCSPLLQSEV